MPNSHVATIDVAEVIHLCVTSVHESYIVLRFTQRPAIFELQAVLRQVHRMTPQ